MKLQNKSFHKSWISSVQNREKNITKTLSIKNYRNEERSFILITHHHRILDSLKPDHVHILIDGEIVLSGGAELANKLEKKGYAWLRKKD